MDWNMSNALAEEIAVAVMDGGAAVTVPGGLYLALFTDDPTKAGIGTEITGGSYNRVGPIAFTSGGDGIRTNTAELVFPTATADWAVAPTPAAYWGLYDSGTPGAGEMKFYGSLTVSREIKDGDTFKVGIGELSQTVK